MSTYTGSSIEDVRICPLRDLCMSKYGRNMASRRLLCVCPLCVLYRMQLSVSRLDWYLGAVPDGCLACTWLPLMLKL